MGFERESGWLALLVGEADEGGVEAEHHHQDDSLDREKNMSNMRCDRKFLAQQGYYESSL